MFSASLLTILLLTLAVLANPVVIRNSPVTLPISRRVNVTSIHNLLRHDLSRAKALRARAEAKIAGGFHVDAVINGEADNQAVAYAVSVGVGSPPSQYELLIDTGSSNTWVGARSSYVRTSTSVQTSNHVSASYGSGSFSGTEFTDTVTLAPGLVIPAQSIGVASTSQGLEKLDGILGIGPVGLTLGTLSPDSATTIPTVTDNAFSKGIIDNNEIGISFAPTDVDGEKNGELTWGGTDSSKFTGSIGYTPITDTSLASQFWGVSQTITYGSTTILPTTAGIVDTGTTLLLLASDAYARYRSATGAVLDNTTGLLRITAPQFANLQSLFFTIGGKTYEFTANAQIWPRALNTDIGGMAGNIYLIVADLGTPSGKGLDFINGLTFLERFYAVFDTANQRVGFATTENTHSTVN